MSRLKNVAPLGLSIALFTVACGGSTQSLNPIAPSALSGGSTALSVDGEVSGASADTADVMGKPADKGKPDDKGGKPDDKGGKPDDKGKPDPGARVVQIEGLIAAISGTSITVNGQTVVVPADAVIRHGSREVAFSELQVGDRVHIKARLQGAVLEAREVKLQNSGRGDDEGEDDEDGEDDGTHAAGSVWVTARDATASESGTDTGVFRLTRLGSDTLPLTSPLTVTFTVTGTATNGTDYASVPVTATFLAGQSTVDVTVTPTADELAEVSETVVLTLTSVAPYALGAPATATVTIADAVVPVVTVAAFDASASDIGPDSGTFRFTRTGSTAAALTVTYTVAGTAVNGTDYEALPLTVTFLAGQATVDRVVVPVVDGTAEGVETVILTLTDGAAYNLGASTAATINIAG